MSDASSCTNYRSKQYHIAGELHNKLTSSEYRDLVYKTVSDTEKLPGSDEKKIHALKSSRELRDGKKFPQIL